MTVAQTAAGLERYRAIRRELEAAILPIASSIDGRRFTFQAPLDGVDLRLGGYVVLDRRDGPALGQILELRLALDQAADLDVPAEAGPGAGLRAGLVLRHAAGEGAVLEDAGAPFHDAPLRPAATADVAAWADRRGGSLDVGELALAPGVPARLDARGFDRHTFLCGQSGSGKTYALGVVLERLLLRTGLRIVVLDPNSDFARLAAVRPGADPALAGRYAEVARGIAVHTARAGGDERLRLRLAELEPEAQAALLRLDPIADREEYAELAALLATGRPPTTEELEASGRPEAHRLALRARNLRVEDFAVWAGEDAGSVLDAVADPAARCVVVDLGSLAEREEQALVAAAVLGELWRRRERREPVLVVIDEAHDVCPGRPADALTALATEHSVRIAAEGRKFGLHLLVSTQRPQKVHENVVSQCDNLVLMRLSSRADAAFAQAIFSFVPAGLVEHAATFGLGEALVAGKIAPDPALVRFGRRLSQEGGADVPVTWATP